MENNNKFRTFLTGLIAGGVIGSLIALLFAPTSGKKLRKKITDKAENLIEGAEEIYESGKEKADELIKEGKRKATGIIEDAKKKISHN